VHAIVPSPVEALRLGPDQFELLEVGSIESVLVDVHQVRIATGKVERHLHRLKRPMKDEVGSEQDVLCFRFLSHPVNNYNVAYRHFIRNHQCKLTPLHAL